MSTGCYTRRDFLKAAGAGIAAAALPGCTGIHRTIPAGASRKRPNFVFILIDDMGWKDLGFMGSRYYKTPNIDKLAGEGVVFTSAYTNGPNCAPTRACIMSGQYTPRHGVYTVGSSERGKAHLRKLIPAKNKTELDPEIVTVAEALKDVGYTSAMIGKWHLGDGDSSPESEGFDVVWRRDKSGHFSSDGQYLTDLLRDKAVEFMEQNRDRPFFLYLSHYAVHTPLQAKEELIEKYTNKPGVAGQNNPVYAAMIESVDENVGRIMESLDRLGLAGNTVVFFFSDNGGVYGITSMQPLRGGKGMLYEGGMRVPMIVRWPDKVRRRMCDVPVIGIDFYPTILEMANAPKPTGHILDGESIAALLSGGKSLSRKAIYWHFPAYLQANYGWKETWRTTPAGAVRAGDWKLIEYFEDERLELYNLKDDIGEQHNLAKQMPAKTSELHDLVVNWRKSVGASVPREQNPLYNLDK